jgi:hypothetical protein
MTSIVCKKCGGYVGMHNENCPDDKPMTKQTLRERIKLLMDSGLRITDPGGRCEEIEGMYKVIDKILSTVMEALPRTRTLDDNELSYKAEVIKMLKGEK